MKFVIPLLLLSTLAFAAPPPLAKFAGSYINLNPGDFANDKNLQSVAEFAQKEIIAKALEAQKIASSDFTFDGILRAAVQVVAGFNYKVLLGFHDTEKKPLYSTAVVFYQPWARKFQLTSYSVGDTPAWD